MKSTHKVSLLAAVALSAALASQSQAAFNYDLRFDPSTSGLVDAHNVVINSTGTYTLQLWGQLTGDTNLTNDGYINGFVGISSAQSGGGAITAGGITAAALGTNVQSAAGGPSVGASNIITNDTIGDWGGSSTGATTGWLKWVGGANPGFADGSTNAQSQQVNGNTWEVLIATYTVTASAVNSGNLPTIATSFNVVAPNGVKSGVSTLQGLLYTLDGSTTPNQNGETTQGVTFHVPTTPEPASLGMLALGGLALINRRRKA